MADLTPVPRYGPLMEYTYECGHVVLTARYGVRVVDWICPLCGHLGGVTWRPVTR